MRSSLWDKIVILMLTFYVLLRTRTCHAHGEWVYVMILALPPSEAVVCHSNARDTNQEEDCGPHGYCFFQDLSSDDGAYYRGCDHIFICELLVDSRLTKPSKYFKKTSKTLKVHYKWCAANVPFVGIDTVRRDGTFCCCNTDFCNKDEPDEPDQPFHRVQQLISGTRADYEELVKVASSLGIIEKAPDMNSHDNCTSHGNRPCHLDDF